jgi:hypothetical protein
MAVVVAETNEAAQVDFGGWKRPILHRDNLARIDRHALAAGPEV